MHWSNQGCSDDTIKSIFDRYPIGKKYKEEGDGYLKRTIEKARQAIEGKKSLAPVATLHKKDDDRVNSHQVVDMLTQRPRRLIYCAAMLYEYMDGRYCQTDDQLVKKWVTESVGQKLSKGQSEEIIYFLQSKVFLHVESLNNTNSLNLKNGLLNFDTWTVSPHTPDVYSTIQLDVTFNPEAKCDLWLQTLHEIFPDDDGAQKISILQEFFGLYTTKENKYEKALLLIGEGANGKSLILWILLHLLKKENVSAIPLEKFDNHFFISSTFWGNWRILALKLMLSQEFMTVHLKRWSQVT